MADKAKVISIKPEFKLLKGNMDFLYDACTLFASNIPQTFGRKLKDHEATMLFKHFSEEIRKYAMIHNQGERND